MSILEVSHIEKRFRAAQVLNDISFTKEDGADGFPPACGTEDAISAECVQR